MAEKHVIPALGARKLVDSTAEKVDAWLAERAVTLSTVSVVRLLSILRSSIHQARARELVRRNVALSCQPPRGATGRPSKSLTLGQARAVLAAAGGTSMLTGARTEELRALMWDHLDLDGDPPSIEVWRSVRRREETKTSRSRRTLELPDRARAPCGGIASCSARRG